jgi:predicted acyltransferase
LALDVFRGLTMASMVIVNNPGDWGHVYAPLLHAEWNGLTFTDLIFPFFLFIVGVSITLSTRSQGPVWPILRRALLVFGLGLFLAGYPRFDATRWRIPGVLQRIAVCYLAAALVYRATAPADLKRLARQAAALTALVAVLLVGYWAAMTLVPVPGGRAGDLSPDGNLAAFIDRALMGGHLWKPTWDPEGLLSTFPAIATTLLGVLTGMWLRARAEKPERGVAPLAAAAFVTLLVGYRWSELFPANKNLWTSSYVLITGGRAALYLAILVWLIDVRGWRGWTKPFVILGMNAITLFVLSGLLVKTLLLIRVPAADGTSVAVSRWIYESFYVPLAAPKNASLLYALTHLVLLFGVLAWMYRRRIFLKV